MKHTVVNTRTYDLIENAVIWNQLPDAELAKFTCFEKKSETLCVYKSGEQVMDLTHGTILVFLPGGNVYRLTTHSGALEAAAVMNGQLNTGHAILAYKAGKRVRLCPEGRMIDPARTDENLSYRLFADWIRADNWEIVP